MKCIVQIDMMNLEGYWEYQSKDWEEFEISLGDTLGLFIRPSVCRKFSTQYLWWSEITFKNLEDEEHFKKLQMIKDIIE